MLWRRVHQHGNTPGRTGARATATSKLATGPRTGVEERAKTRQKERCTGRLHIKAWTESGLELNE